MKILLISLIILTSLVACDNLILDQDKTNNPKENFEYLWKQIDEKYSYFDVKGIDWNVIHNKYSQKISDNMSNEELFSVLFQMLGELKDGHVNLQSSFNISRYNITNNRPENFNWRLIKDYYLEPSDSNKTNVEDHFYVTGSLYHQVFNMDGYKIGYVYCNSFADPISEYDIDYVLNRMYNTNGLIIDVRNNGGGSPVNIFKILQHLTNEKRFVYSTKLKNGPGHEDFADSVNVYCNPANSFLYLRPVVVLTNRNCYSATSFFAAALKAFPNVIQVGDTTGGGAGMPHGGQLPNGWYYRFSVSRTVYPWDGKIVDFEKGVPPEIVLNINNSHPKDDELIDTAIEIIKGVN